MEKVKRILLLYKRLEYITGHAFFSLLLGSEALGAITACTAEKPAEVATLEFPGRALVFFLTLFYLPARGEILMPAPLV